MNMKYLVILVGACLGLAAGTGCVVVNDGTGGTGGGVGASGGTGGTGGGTGGQGGGVGGTGGGSGGQGGTGGGGACVGCAEYVTDGVGTLCDGTSTDLYNALADCTCNGACMDLCLDNVCMEGGTATQECLDCIGDTVAGCGTEFNECSNDV